MDLETIQELQEIGEKIQEHLVEETEPETEPRQWKQYKLLLPPYLSEALRQLGERRGMTMADLIRYAIKLLLAITANLEPGAKLVIQQEDKPDYHIIITV